MNIRLVWQGLLALALYLPADGQTFHQTDGIVYPFRAAPVIVKSGDPFHILFGNRQAGAVDSVVLKGDYWRVALQLDTVESGRFEFDSFTRSYTNSRLWVCTPADSPEELYDLIVYAGGETYVSRSSVKVVKSFSPAHTFIHFSDPHTSRNWVGTPQDGYAKELELLDRFIEVANIIGPDFVIVTGDLIHDYTRLDADADGWGGTLIKGYDQLPTVEEKFRNYFEGAKGFRGVQAIEAPVFSIPGNHDFYGMPADDYLSKAKQWNSLCGQRVYGVSYAGTRLLFADDYLGDPVTDVPDAAPMSGLQGNVLESFLDREGPGLLRIMAQHRHNRFDTTFLDKHRVKLVLNGHNHSPKVDTLGTTPTLSMRTGVVCRSGETKRWEKVLGLFRIFRVDGAEVSHSQPLRFCVDPTVPYDDIKLNLTRTFTSDNTGHSTANTATIINRLPVDLPDCHVRFVLKKGNYAVQNGTVRQVVDTDRLTIIDVRVPVKADDRQVVTVQLRSAQK